MIVQSEPLDALPGIAHGFGTREGGVSTGIYSALNCGVGSNDNQEHVAQNRKRFANRLGVTPDKLVCLHQVHSPDVVVVEKPWDRAQAPKADALVTARAGLALGVLSADCVPVLFADEEAKIVGAAHAGWRGALTGVLEATLEAMTHLGAARGRITCCIGPAISGQVYEVGNEFREKFLQEDDASSGFFHQENEQSRPHFDLKSYVASRLRRAGAGKVDDLQLCTYCEPARFFSYRRSCHRNEADYGRQISAIIIE